MPDAAVNGGNAAGVSERPAIDAIQLIVQTYARAFLSQGVGIIGLAWCLYDRHVLLGAVLTVLLLVDQAIFLPARFAPAAASVPFRTPLNFWCLFVSVLDVLILYAMFYQAAGLREPSSEAAVVDPSNFLAFSISIFIHGPVDLVPRTGAGRLLVAGEGLLGYVMLIAAGVAVSLVWTRRRDTRGDRSDRPDHAL